MFATIYLPNFFLQAALRQSHERNSQPVGLIDGEKAKPVFLQLNSAAEKLGVHAGMTPSQGLARCLDLIVKTRAREQEILASAILFEFAYSLAPQVEKTAAGICTIEFSDPRNLETKIARVLEQLAQLHLTAQGGIAPTPDASLLAAHLAQPILRIDDAKKFLAPLPIETLISTL